MDGASSEGDQHALGLTILLPPAELEGRPGIASTRRAQPNKYMTHGLCGARTNMCWCNGI